MSVSLVVVGGGPRALGLLLRLGANLPLLAPDLDLDVHVVDPHPAGGGRIWRHAQSALLWMNSTAADITVFTGPAVDCAGPVDDGPSLLEWSRGPGRDWLSSSGFDVGAAGLDPGDFAPRGIQAEYLRWAWERAVAGLPSTVRVHEHATSALDVVDTQDGGQQVGLADGRRLDADTVVLAQGYLDQEPSPTEHAWGVAAQARGLTYVPPGFTADLDLSDLRPGEDVLVRGLGLAFVDLAVLVTQGRGGRFSGSGDDLTYHPSGREPVLHAGSGRGVPYHAKLGYDLGTTGPTPPVHLTPAAFPGAGTVDWECQVLPLLRRELTDAHYRRLFEAHPERTRGPWSRAEGLIAESDVTSTAFATAMADLVPDPQDRFDLRLLDRPLAGHDLDGAEQADAAVAEHIAADLRRRRDPAFSADRAVFDRLLTAYAVLTGLARDGRLRERDRVFELERRFHGFFSFLASGPPPRRLAELLALRRAGLLRFLGPGTTAQLEEDGFRAHDVAGGVLCTRALVDARIPVTDVRTARDPLIRNLVRRGELRAHGVHDPATGRHVAGRLVADDACRAVRPDGTVHPDRYLVGPAVTGSVGSGGFARPSFDAPGLRQNDELARRLIRRFATDRHRPTIAKEHRHAS